MIRHRQRLLAPLLIVFALASGACAGNPKPDTSGLDATGLRDLRRVQVVKVVRDITTGATAANKAKTLSDAIYIEVLKINYQVLDIIEADPVGYSAKISAYLTNARDALPEAIKSIVDGYILRISDALKGVQ